jgi:uncharacterized protein (TIGR00290 family)
MRNRGGEFRMKILFTWSGGKDSALALFEILNRGGVEVCALLTTVTEDYGRVSMHGVRETLLEQQSKALGIPLHTVRIGKDATNERYENGMREVLEEYKESGVKSVAYGDLFLEEIRSYREKNLEAVGMKALFPLWGRDTNTLGRRFLDLGFRAIVTCVDLKSLKRSFCGREYDADFINDLPHSVDPCGENGEFHTFVYDGPLFEKAVAFRRGEVVRREHGLYFCDLFIGE